MRSVAWRRISSLELRELPDPILLVRADVSSAAVTFEEFLAAVSTEAPRVKEIEVSVPAPALLNDIARRGGMSFTEFLADPRRHEQRRTVRTGHVFGPPLEQVALEKWMRDCPRHPLPGDLRELLQHADGLHLWADLDTGRSYQGLAPIAEWELARTRMWGSDADPDSLGDEYLALSYHADGAAYVVLKATTGEYFLMDSAGADETCRIGDDVASLLDWLWESR